MEEMYPHPSCKNAGTNDDENRIEQNSTNFVASNEIVPPDINNGVNKPNLTEKIFRTTSVESRRSVYRSESKSNVYSSRRGLNLF